jgi:Tol biopolymer transport system component/DNA-binding winged helix-turn-helix (wHTH) protein
VSRPDLTRARSGRQPIPVGDWVLHADLGVLRRGKQEQRLNAKALHVLLVLVDAEGAAVSRDDLLSAVWGDRYPTDSVVSRAIADLRGALGEAAGDHVYINTVPKFGYQLLAKGGPKQEAKASQWVFAVLPALWFLILWWSWPGERPATSFDRLPPAVPLTAEPGLEHQPRFSAEGNWVVYAALRPGQDDWDLFRVSIEDGTTQAVAAVSGVHEHGPAISPHGEQVAYVRLSGTGCEVVTQSITFGVPEPVAQCTAKFPTLVDWSPDGTQLIFTVDEQDDTDGYRRLYQLDLATGTSARLSSAVSPTGSDFYPRYSPSGNVVAFLRGEPQPDHRSSLWLVDRGTGEETRLTPQAVQLGGMTWIDDDQLLYTINDAGRLESRLIFVNGARSQKLAGPDLAHPEFNANKNMIVAAMLRSERDLAVVDATGEVSAVASSTSDDHHGVLQPGGKYIAYISRRSGYDEIWLYDVGAETARQLTFFEGATVRYPAWHPDGLRLLFTAQGDAGERIYEIDVLSGATRQFGATDVEATTPNWLPDGQAAVFGCAVSGAGGVCVATGEEVREIALGFFRPVVLNQDRLVVADSQGILYLMRISDGSTQALWDGMPGVGRYGWTVHADWLYYIDPVPGKNSANLVWRNLTNGDEKLLYTGPMPVADTTLSYDVVTKQLLFTRYQAASDDLVTFALGEAR